MILRQNGTTETYTIPWLKDGIPLTVLGASAGPRMNQKQQPRAVSRAPLYQQMLDRMRYFELPGRLNVVGFGELKPVFTMPANFVQRLGRRSFDSYFTGTFTTDDGTRVGFLRVPDFGYPSMTDLDREIKFFQTNTDVLVVDLMRNPGGSVCSAEEIMSRLTPNPFQGAAAEIRVGWYDVVEVNQALVQAEEDALDEDTIALLKLYLAEFRSAYVDRQGRTTALPLCGSTTDRLPSTASNYTKPVLLLVDEMSASSADIFAGMVQDNRIGTVFGYRTMGAGGSPTGQYAGVYSEGITYVTRSLIVRSQPVVTPDFPTTRYIENVGVRPDTVVDYMTVDNLLNGGAAFVKAFTDEAAKLAKAGK